MNIIVLDIAMSTLYELQLICNEYEISYDFIKDNKLNHPISKIWVDSESKKFIAYEFNDGSGKVNMYGWLNAIEPVKPKSAPVVLDMDTILDKISNFGIDSLVKEEKSFLDSIK